MPGYSSPYTGPVYYEHQFFTASGTDLNPLVQAASPLLLLTAQLRETLSPMDVPGLRRHTLEEIRGFEEQARSSGVPEKIVLSDPGLGSYKKLVIADGRLTGAVLFGDTADGLWYLDQIRSGDSI